MPTAPRPKGKATKIALSLLKGIGKSDRSTDRENSPPSGGGRLPIERNKQRLAWENTII